MDPAAWRGLHFQALLRIAVSFWLPSDHTSIPDMQRVAIKMGANPDHTHGSDSGICFVGTV